MRHGTHRGVYSGQYLVCTYQYHAHASTRRIAHRRDSIYPIILPRRESSLLILTLLATS